jgi:hypothetical protein
VWSTANIIEFIGLIMELLAVFAVILTYQADRIRGVLRRIYPTFETRKGARWLLLIAVLFSVGGVSVIHSFHDDYESYFVVLE